VSSDATETKQKLLDAAFALLDEGRVPLVIDDVARAADVSRQAVYLHFSSRAELLVQASDAMRRRIGFDEALGSVLASATGDDALEALLRVHVRFQPRLVRALRAVEAERLRDPTVEKAWQSRPARGKHTVRRVVERLHAEGRLAEGWTVEDAAALLSVLLSPATTEDLTGRRGWSRSRLLGRLRDMVRGALLAPSPRRRA
jgi:AcrR family transcriptional regulator